MRRPGRTRNVVVAALVPLLLPGLTGCGSDEPADSSASATSPTAVISPSTSPTTPPTGGSSDDLADNASAAPAEDPAEAGRAGGYTLETLLPAMKAAVKKNPTTQMRMKIDAGGQTIRADGVVAYDKSGPRMAMTMSGASIGGDAMEIRMIDQLMYVSLPPMTPPGKFLEVDLSDRSGPLANLPGLTGQDPLSTFAAFDAGLEKVRYVGKETVDGEHLDHYLLTVDAAAAARAQGTPDVAGMPAEVEYDLWLDDRDLMRRITFDMPDQVAMDMTMSHWGEPVTVEPPAAGDIVKTPGS
ncbi:MAG TPA: LppX_LprAFG lipoprotein [Nocardioidaceae bacterium]|nr:LppX_LprAFG lipoprotein [Nocardioidaceae bacterium]